MNLNEYLMSQRDPDDYATQYDQCFPLAERIKCADGFSLSVQATHRNRCAPRTNIGPWAAVEVGSPSAKPELIMDYAEDREEPTETVYAWVPVELVEALIAAHGGPVVEPQGEAP